MLLFTFLVAHHFRHTVIHVFVVLAAVFLQAVDSFISVVSSCDITGKREWSCSGPLLLSFGMGCCSCSSSCMFCVCNVAVPGTSEDVNVPFRSPVIVLCLNILLNLLINYR